MPAICQSNESTTVNRVVTMSSLKELSIQCCSGTHCLILDQTPLVSLLLEPDVSTLLLEPTAGFGFSPQGYPALTPCLRPKV